MGAGIVGQVFADQFAGGRIQACQVMTGLADEPDMADAGGKRIAGAAAIGYWSFLYIDGVQGIGGASRPEQQGHKDQIFRFHHNLAGNGPLRWPPPEYKAVSGKLLIHLIFVVVFIST